MTKSKELSIVIVHYGPNEYRATTTVRGGISASGSTRTEALQALEEKLVLEDFRT